MQCIIFCCRFHPPSFQTKTGGEASHECTIVELWSQKWIYLVSIEKKKKKVIQFELGGTSWLVRS